MALTLLAAKTTPISADQAAKALSAAYKSVVGRKPSFNILKLLVGQWASETGNGKSIYNYNFGNTMPTGSDKFYQVLHASEVIDGVNTPMDEKFAAYKTITDGAQAYIKVLKSRAHWWKGLQSGNIDDFITGLTTSPKYFTASPASYKKLLTDRVSAYSQYAKKYSSNILLTIVESVFGIGLGTAALYAFHKRHRHGA